VAVSKFEFGEDEASRYDRIRRQRDIADLVMHFLKAVGHGGGALRSGQSALRDQYRHWRTPAGRRRRHPRREAVGAIGVSLGTPVQDRCEQAGIDLFLSPQQLEDQHVRQTGKTAA
jgi:hypothetical protein